MDVNWYAAETIVQETLHARRAKAEMARLAATARPYRTCRGIGAALLKLGRALVGNLARLCPSRPRREARRDDEPVALTRHRILVRPGASSPVIASMSTRATIRTESPVGGRLRKVGGWLRMAHAR
jgi:hypothetical protein